MKTILLILAILAAFNAPQSIIDRYHAGCVARCTTASCIDACNDAAGR